MQIWKYIRFLNKRVFVYHYGSFKVHLHYGKNHVKLVGFKEQKKYWAFLKPANLMQFFP